MKSSRPLAMPEGHIRSEARTTASIPQPVQAVPLPARLRYALTHPANWFEVLRYSAVGLTGSQERRLGRLLSRRTPVFLGKVSYGTYLWHWPVLLLAPRVLGAEPGLLVDDLHSVQQFDAADMTESPLGSGETTLAPRLIKANQGNLLIQEIDIGRLFARLRP